MQKAKSQAGRPLIDYMLRLKTNPPKTLSQLEFFASAFFQLWLDSLVGTHEPAQFGNDIVY